MQRMQSWEDRVAASTLSGYKMYSVNPSLTKLPFDCRPHKATGKRLEQAIELNSEFRLNALAYESEMISKTYVWLDESDPVVPRIVAYATVRNSSLQMLRAPVQMQSVNGDRYQDLFEAPVVLLEALAVASENQGRDLGKWIIWFIASWFALPDNKSGCRFLLISAYRDVATYYTDKLGFLPVRPFDGDEDLPAYYYYDFKWLKLS